MHEGQSLAAYDGLVFKTAEMFSAMVGMEREDLQQELRIRVFKAKRMFDPARSNMTESTYIFSCVTNFVKDLKRKAAFRSGAVRIEHIEDHREEDLGDNDMARFEFRYMHVSEEEAFAILGQFTMPATITDRERDVLALLVAGYEHGEIAGMLTISKWAVSSAARDLRAKLADWRPSGTSESDAPASPPPGAPALAQLAPPASPPHRAAVAAVPA